MGKVMNVKLADVKESPVALREVDQASEAFQEFVGSIRENGIINPPVLRVKQSPEGTKYYEIIDGLHRVTGARAANLTEIPAHIVEAEDGRVMELQIIGNIQKVETRLAQYSDQLKRILSMNPLMTKSELATKLGKSPTWIEQRLSLIKIMDPDIKVLIDEGKIKLANAYALAKLPPEEMKHFVQGAMTEPGEEFSQRVNQRVKEIRDATRQGRAAVEQDFVPVAHLRKVGEAKAEIDSGCPSGKDMTKEVEGFKLGILWMLHNDPKSLKAQQAKYDASQTERKARAEKRAQEAAQRKKDRAELAAKEAANAEAKINGKTIPHPELEAKG